MRDTKTWLENIQKSDENQTSFIHAVTKAANSAFTRPDPSIPNGTQSKSLETFLESFLIFSVNFIRRMGTEVVL